MPKLILLNGPPRSGKDECARMLYSKHLGTRSVPFPHWFRMSQPIKDAIRATFNLTEAEQEELEKKKDQPSALLRGKTYRQVQISYSEEWMKPLFGPDVFGRIALRRMLRSVAEVFVCSDAGFAEEIEPLFTMFRRDEVLLIKLVRDGCTFDGDSRTYIHLDDVHTLWVKNNSTLPVLFDQVLTLVEAWLDGKREA